MSKKNKLLTLFLIFIAAPLLGLSLASLHIYQSIHAPYEGETKSVTINKGEGFSSINYKLSQEGLINNARIFHYYTLYKDSLRKFKPGTYTIESGDSMIDIFLLLTSGKGAFVKITIPEGKNLYEIAELLEEAKFVKKEEFIELCFQKELLRENNVEAFSAEGYLYPDTYKVSPGVSAKFLVELLIKTHFQKTAKLRQINHALNYHEILTLASIVEKETGAKWERPTIAGVYLNRLRKKMRLQADPTTIYGIWTRFDGNLRRKDLLEKNDYNTYMMSGLPKGPIANPGLAAIQAVYHPKQHDYLFFVSKNDGTHVFTSTYEQHRKAVQYWQKNRRNRKGKSWRDLKQ
jgi:UPF0755 protein